jgi:hypothetical protein
MFHATHCSLTDTVTKADGAGFENRPRPLREAREKSTLALVEINRNKTKTLYNFIIT